MGCDMVESVALCRNVVCGTTDCVSSRDILGSVDIIIAGLYLSSLLGEDVGKCVCVLGIVVVVIV